MLRRSETIDGVDVILEQAPFTHRVAGSRNQGESFRSEGEYGVFVVRNGQITARRMFGSFDEADAEFSNRCQIHGRSVSRYTPGKRLRNSRVLHE